MYDYFEIVLVACDCRQTSVVVSATSAVAHRVVAGLDRKILLCQVECTAQAHDFVYKPSPLAFFISVIDSVVLPCINTLFLYLVVL